MPLFDFAVLDGNSQTESTERLAAVRMICDGFASHADHLNLCRKNAYNRLMLLYPILSKDTKTSHAILDIFDRALGLRVSARYLIERCAFLPWLQQVLAPVRRNKMHKSANKQSRGNGNHVIRKDSQAIVEEEIAEEDHNLDDHEKFLAIAETSCKYQEYVAPFLCSRFISLLRKALGASYLLSADGLDITVLINMIYSCICMVLQYMGGMGVMQGKESVVESDGSSVEIFHQLILVMWDMSVIILSIGRDELKGLSVWNHERILSICRQILLTSNMADNDRDDLILSFLMLLSFQSTTIEELTLVNDVFDLISSVCTRRLLLFQSSSVPCHEYYAILNNMNIKILSTGNQKYDRYYYNAVHLLSQCSKDIYSIPTGSRSNNNNLSFVLDKTWKLFAKTSFESVNLITGMNPSLILIFLLRNIRLIPSRHINCNNIESNNLASVRFPLATYFAVFKTQRSSTSSFLNGYDEIIIDRNRHCLSLVESVSFDIINETSTNLILLYQLTIYAIVMTFKSSLLDGNNMHVVKKHSYLVLHTLIGNIIKVENTVDNFSVDDAIDILRSPRIPMILECLCRDNVKRSIVVELCHLYMDILSATVTTVDRRNTSVLTGESQHDRLDGKEREEDRATCLEASCDELVALCNMLDNKDWKKFVGINIEANVIKPILETAHDTMIDVPVLHSNLDRRTRDLLVDSNKWRRFLINKCGLRRPHISNSSDAVIIPHVTTYDPVLPVDATKHWIKKRKLSVKGQNLDRDGSQITLERQGIPPPKRKKLVRLNLSFSI